MKTIVVTRHRALLEYLREIGLTNGTEEVFTHVTADDVYGKHVIGVIPARLATQAWCVTEVPLDVPEKLRGKELTLEQIRKCAGEPWTYCVTEVNW